MQVGTTVNHQFVLEARAGEGGVGEVWRAKDRVSGEVVAIKFVKPEVLAQDPGFAERFVLSGSAIGKIQHKGLTKIRAVGGGAPEHPPYVVTEWLEGELLSEVIARGKPGEHLGSVRAVIDACAALHAARVVHRDLKPQNVMVLPEGGIKLFDFDFALSLDQRPATVERISTPLYSSPEQCHDAGQVDARADVYSLGVMLFSAFEGRPPTEAESLSHPPSAARGYQALVALCLAEDPADRPADAQVLGVALRKAVDAHESITTVDLSDTKRTRPTPPQVPHPGAATSVAEPPARRRGLVATLVLVAGFAAGGIAWFSNPGGDGLNGGGGIDGGTPAPPAPPTVPAPTVRVLVPSEMGFPVQLRVDDGEPFSPDPGVEPVDAGGGDQGWSIPPLAQGPHRVQLLRTADGLVLSEVEVTGSHAGVAATIVFPPHCPDGMRYVPGGTFQMGAAEPDVDGGEQPSHAVELSAFCIDRYETTVRSYQRCVDDHTCEARTTSQAESLTAAQARADSTHCNLASDDRDEHPVNCVSWRDARAFCGHRQADLPTEAQWEFAARGTDDRLYPWGSELPDQTRGNYCDAGCVAARMAPEGVSESMFPGTDGWAHTAPVGRFPAGRSPFGVDDLGGNVWEWVRDLYRDYQPSAAPLRDPVDDSGEGNYRVTRGGSAFSADANYVRAITRSGGLPDDRRISAGFRCASVPLR